MITGVCSVATILSLQIAALLLSSASFGILILSLRSIELTVEEDDGKLLIFAEEDDIASHVTVGDAIFCVLVAFNSTSSSLP